MNDELLALLGKTPPFSSLPEKVLRETIARMTEINIAPGVDLSHQGRTVDRLFIVAQGVLELYFSKMGEKILGGLVEPGQTYGGISMLMNDGISFRTVIPRAGTRVFTLDREGFLELCGDHTNFKQFFLEGFSRNMLDESYAQVVSASQDAHFLSKFEPFSFLDEEELERIAFELSIVHFHKHTTLFVQGRSKVDQIFIIRDGAAERYFEEGDHKVLRGILGEGEIYGGISILLNHGISTHTVQVYEETYLYVLSKETFLDLCGRFEAFRDYFTDTFGKRMLDRSYAAVIAKTISRKDPWLEFFDQPIRNIFNESVISCGHGFTIQEAARAMSRHHGSSIFVKNGNDHFIGVVTDSDLRKRVVAEGYSVSRPVTDVMSSPLRTIPAQSLVLEALMIMMRENIKHLGVTDGKGEVIGVVTNRDLLDAQGQSPFFLIRDISEARDVEEVRERQKVLPYSVQSLIKSGAKAKNVTRLITSVSDAVYEKLISFALDELGPAPNRFVFMIFGSDGRKEQTLKTDQDNALMYEDVPPDLVDDVHGYYLKLGETVCNWLDYVGYEFCKGEVMAKNPQWCQPVSVWKDYFATWINTGRPEALLKASIFFDFRWGYGDQALVEELREKLFSSLLGWAGFFRNLTENALYFKPPLGFFRNFVVESKGQHRNAFNIKSAMQPIVDIARIQALKHKVEETNTQDRLHEVFLKGGFGNQDYNELEQAYSYLMQTRLVRQVTAIMEEGAEPDNYINPKKLSRIEQTMLKEIFRRIEKAQASLGLEFTGLT